MYRCLGVGVPLAVDINTVFRAYRREYLHFFYPKDATRHPLRMIARENGLWRDGYCCLGKRLRFMPAIWCRSRSTAAGGESAGRAIRKVALSRQSSHRKSFGSHSLFSHRVVMSAQ
jgi:hypothetical protein